LPPDHPTLLAFDTSAAHCVAVLLHGDDILAQRQENFGRAQVEQLMPMLVDMLSQANIDWQGLDAVAVCTGPGNFTGTRIGVSAARGLAMSLDIPAIGVSAFEAAALAHPAGNQEFIVAIGLPRGQFGVQKFSGGQPPIAVSQPSIAEQGEENTFGIEHLAEYARLLFRQGNNIPRPAPLYLRAADAAPAKDKPPVILDER